MHMIGIMSLCIIYVLYVIMNKFAMVVFHYGPFKKKQLHHSLILPCRIKCYFFSSSILPYKGNLYYYAFLTHVYFSFIGFNTKYFIFTYLTFENIRVLYLDIYF